jgi:hypothetical protein
MALAEPPPPSDRAVRYADDKLTIRVQGMPAEALVAEIAKQAGAKVTGTVGKATPITADWTALPVKDALEQILGPQNFTLTYGEKGELRVIALRGGQQEGTPKPPAEDTKNRDTSAETALFKTFDIRDQIPIDGAVAKRLGKTTAPWDLVTNTGIGDDDPAVRRSAVKAGVEAFEANETMRQAVVSVTGEMTDAQLAAFARAYMYHRAEDFLRNIRRETSLPDVQERARAVLRELRKIPFEGPEPIEGSGSKTPE